MWSGDEENKEAKRFVIIAVILSLVFAPIIIPLSFIIIPIFLIRLYLEEK